MKPSGGPAQIVSLEPLLDAVREGVELSGWSLSGLQKTTSHEFDGAWAGESTRSAYLFFHRDDLPECVSVEGYLDETSRGLRGNLALVLEGPTLEQLGAVRGVLERVGCASDETLPPRYHAPVSVRLAVPRRGAPAGQAGVQVRFKLVIPSPAMQAGASAVSALASEAVSSFETLLERPEVAELLPSLVE